MSNRPVVLVVDDDGPILLLMRNILREFGFDAVVARSGNEAIDAVQTQRPDLILLDRNMPGMSGDEVLQKLRNTAGLDSTPVLILSGEPIEPDEIDRIGATGAVLKPFDVPALVAAIRTHVNAA
jgi:DNA-binding response OmpR family regulator